MHSECHFRLDWNYKYVRIEAHIITIISTWLKLETTALKVKENHCWCWNMDRILSPLKGNVLYFRASTLALFLRNKMCRHWKKKKSVLVLCLNCKTTPCVPEQCAFEKGLFKCPQTHSQHKHLLMESVWRNLWSVCHHCSELWCHFVDTLHPNHQPECDIKDLTKTSCPGLPDFNKLQLRVDMGRCSSMYKAPMVAHGCPCVCLLLRFLFLRDTPPTQRKWQLTAGGGGNRACSTKRGRKKKKKLTPMAISCTCCWLSHNFIHSLPCLPSLSLFSSSTSPVTQLWVIKLSRRGGWWLGDLEGGIRVRGGDRVLTHRLSNGFQRPPDYPALCSTRANQEWRLTPFGQCKGSPTPVRWRHGQPTPPPPGSPPLGKCRVKRADSRPGKEKTDSKCTKKPQKKKKQHSGSNMEGLCTAILQCLFHDCVSDWLCDV